MRHLTKNEYMMKEHELKTDPQVFDAAVNEHTTQTRKNLIDLINGYLPSE